MIRKKVIVFTVKLNGVLIKLCLLGENRHGQRCAFTKSLLSSMGFPFITSH